VVRAFPVTDGQRERLSRHKVEVEVDWEQRGLRLNMPRLFVHIVLPSTHVVDNRWSTCSPQCVPIRPPEGTTVIAKKGRSISYLFSWHGSDEKVT
jgi:hypothetical protein